MRESEVILLARNGTYRLKKMEGRIEETHISWVILTRKHAFKIKKPIKLSFLNFSTLKQRQKNCEREILLNSRFTDIYESVLPIRKFVSHYSIGGNQGSIIDYAVQMKRMAVTKRMDNVLRNGKVTENSIRALALIIASFHKRAEKIYKPFRLSEARSLFNNINEVRKFISANLGMDFGAIIYESVLWSNRFLREHGKRIQERIKEGYKRDVHGDLHSGNIFLYRNPVLFDCIEFNDEFRQIDVLYEVAFLYMDLEAFGRKALAKKFLIAYKHSFDCFKIKDDINIFNYYKCLRANVRAKVHSMSALQADNDCELQHHLKEIRKYLKLISAYIRR